MGGYSGRRHFYETYAAAKSALAQLLACPPADVALVGSASDGIGVVASGLRFSPGENIVTVAHEFPSVSVPWLRLRSYGLEVREVEPSAARPLADLIGEACDSRTRLIAVSHVSYLTGERVELGALNKIAAAHGALLLVDASHSLGVLPVDAGAADFLVSCAYKFLLAKEGPWISRWTAAGLSRCQDGHFVVSRGQ